MIKRQYIDPSTGQIIEYDPNNELFANLPPETVFEEHTIISDDSSGNPPIVTTTTLSKSAHNSNTKQNMLVDQFGQFNISDQQQQQRLSAKDYADNVGIYSSVKLGGANLQENIVNVATSMKIKSHPEDNQGKILL